jgi:hypothetical protein
LKCGNALAEELKFTVPFSLSEISDSHGYHKEKYYLPGCGYHVVYYKLSGISEEPAAFIFRVKE